MIDRPVIRALLPTVGFWDFHPDANINYQLNRFLVPGMDEEFARIGKAIRNFNDWKAQFLSAAAAHEKDDRLREAAGLYRAAEFFMSPGDPDRTFAFEKFIALFYQVNGDPGLRRMQIPFAQGVLHGLRIAPVGPVRGAVVMHAGFDAYVEEFYAMGQAIALQGYDVVMFGWARPRLHADAREHPDDRKMGSSHARGTRPFGVDGRDPDRDQPGRLSGAASRRV